jgi:type III secretory pathway component EscU
MEKRRKDGSLKMVSRKNNKQKKIKKAAALRYLPHNDNAPKVTAVGKGRIAEKILEAAEKNKIPVYQAIRFPYQCVSIVFPWLLPAYRR